MATASVSGSGASTIVVPQTSTGNTSTAQTTLNTVTSLISSGAVTIGGTLSGAASSQPTTPTAFFTGGSSPTSAGNLNIGTLGVNAVTLVNNNTGTTTASNTQFNGGQTVVSGTGNLVFTDNGKGTTINTGGGTNTISFSATSQGGSFAGDGTNTIIVNSTSGATTISGTSSSVDTITSGSSSVVYNSTAGSKGFINPGSGNVTIVGSTTGTATLIGGTGSSTVTGGTGFFQGGSGGNNLLTASSAGSTTLVGGGNNDMLKAGGQGDVLVGNGTGASTLDGSAASGGVTFTSGTVGSSLAFGSKTIGDTFNIGVSTVSGVGFTGEYIAAHTSGNSALYNLNTTVSNTFVVGGSGKDLVTVGDFISGVDKLTIANAQGSFTLSFGTFTSAVGSNTTGVTSGAVTTLTTASGSTLTFYNTTLKATDITRF